MKFNCVFKKLTLQKCRIIYLYSFLIIGCSAQHLPKYECNSSNNKLNSITQNGLSVSINPLTDKSEIKKYFGTDLLSKKILPVFVIAKNQNFSSSFILFKNRFSLRRKDASLADGPNLSRAGSSGDVAGVVFGATSLLVPGLSLVGLPAFAGIIAQSNEIEHNILSKELQTKTLSPEKTIQGFIFFQITDSGISLDQFCIHLEALNTKTNESKLFDFQLH